jgi:hypothetical protein
MTGDRIIFDCENFISNKVGIPVGKIVAVEAK